MGVGWGGGCDPKSNISRFPEIGLSVTIHVPVAKSTNK